MTDLAALNDADLDALRLAVLLEQERRNLLVQAPAAAVELATRYAAAIGRKEGDPYQPVTGAHDSYPPGFIVSDGGNHYRATAWASHAPGTTSIPRRQAADRRLTRGQAVALQGHARHARWLGAVRCHPRRVDGHRPRLSRAN